MIILLTVIAIVVAGVPLTAVALVTIASRREETRAQHGRPCSRPAGARRQEAAGLPRHRRIEPARGPGRARDQGRRPGQPEDDLLPRRPHHLARRPGASQPVPGSRRWPVAGGPGRARGAAATPLSPSRRAAVRPGALLPYAAVMRVALCQLPVSSDPSVNLGRAQGGGSRRGGGAEPTWRCSPRGCRPGSGPTCGRPPSLRTARSARAFPRPRREHGVAVVAGVFEPGARRPGLQHRGRVRRRGAPGRRVPEDPPVRRARPPGVRPGRAGRTSRSSPSWAACGSGVLTCYDIRFPELARALVARGGRPDRGAGRLGRRAVQGGALGHAGPRAGHREHGVGGGGRPGA